MTPSQRDGSGWGEQQPTQPDGTPLRYIAPMPSTRPQNVGPTEGYGGGTPPPQNGPRKNRNGWLAPLAVILVSLAALAAVFLVTQTGGDDKPADAPTSLPEQTSTPSPTTSDETPQTSSSSSSTSESSTSTSTSSSSSTSATLPAGVKVCGPGVGAGATTTCGFAQNVASAVRSAGKDSGTFTVGAWSPTTKKDYTLRCTASDVTVCTGGRAAVIYVTR